MPATALRTDRPRLSHPLGSVSSIHFQRVLKSFSACVALALETYITARRFCLLTYHTAFTSNRDRQYLETIMNPGSGGSLGPCRTSDGRRPTPYDRPDPLVERQTLPASGSFSTTPSTSPTPPVSPTPEPLPLQTVSSVGAGNSPVSNQFPS